MLFGLHGIAYGIVTDNLCQEGFTGHSIFVSISPIVFVLMIGVLIFILGGIYELVKIMIGKTWTDIKLTSEFKDAVDGLDIRYEDQEIAVDLMKEVEDLENSILNVNVILKNVDSMIDVYNKVNEYEETLNNDKLTEISKEKLREELINKSNYLLGINNQNADSYEAEEDETIRQISYNYDVYISDVLYLNPGLGKDQKLAKGIRIYLPDKQSLPSQVKDELRLKDSIVDYLENLNIEKSELKVLIIKDKRVLNKFKEEENKRLTNLKNKIKTEKNKEEYKKALLYNDLYFERNFQIANLTDNPYGLKLIGKDRNKNKQGLIIIEKKIQYGWGGILKMMTIDEKTRNIDDFTLDEMFKFKENISNTYYYEIDFTAQDYVNKVIIKGNGDEKGVYLAETKTLLEKILSGALVLVLFIVAIGILTGFVQGSAFSLDNLFKSFTD